MCDTIVPITLLEFYPNCTFTSKTNIYIDPKVFAFVPNSFQTTVSLKYFVTDSSSFTRVLFTSLQNSASGSALLKLTFTFNISSDNLEIILLVCSYILKNKSVI